jgi:hypothetical protein
VISGARTLEGSRDVKPHHLVRILLTLNPNCFVERVLHTFPRQCRAFEVSGSADVFLHIHSLGVRNGLHAAVLRQCQSS